MSFSTHLIPNPSKDILVNTYPEDFAPKFSMVMPVHNEGESIERVVKEVYEKLAKKIPFEIILSEDGSKDNTKEVIQNLSKKIPLKATLSFKKKGYSGGIKAGLDLVTSPFVIVSDSDGQHDPNDFWKMMDRFEEEGYDKNVIISGERAKRADVFHRKLMSKTFQKISSIVFDLPIIKDITSAFKLMETKLAKEIGQECKYMEESFWTEFTIRACHRNVKIIEIPVRHVLRMSGETIVYKKSKIPKIAINQLKGMIKLKKELSKKTLLKALIETKVGTQLLTFGLVGASGAGIILFLTWLGVTTLNLHYMIAAFIAIEISIVWAFTLNNRITFRKAPPAKLLHKFLKYHGTALSGEGINLSILFILTSIGIFYLFSEFIAILVAFGSNFILSKKFVWKY